MSKKVALLCIDAGNTLVKWCLHLDATAPFSTAHQLHSEPTSHFKPFSGAAALVQQYFGKALQIAEQPVGAVLLSNVLGPDFEQAVRTLCAEHQLPLHVLTVNAHSQVQTAYAEPATLGKDRWAACLAVSQSSKAMANLLVSFGTATTLDALVNTGRWEHLGGFIVPGIHTMFDSLHSNTAQLPKVQLGLPRASGVWPVSTYQAISEGVGRAQLALIQSLLDELQAQFGQSPALWLSGGFATQMANFLPGSKVLDHAVFRGLVFDYQLSQQDPA